MCRFVNGCLRKISLTYCHIFSHIFLKQGTFTEVSALGGSKPRTSKSRSSRRSNISSTGSGLWHRHGWYQQDCKEDDDEEEEEEDDNSILILFNLVYNSFGNKSM